MKNGGKERLVPKLRFPEFRDEPEWEASKVEELVDTVTPPKKLPTSEYLPSGPFPIVDQSQSEICGWTGDRDALITERQPLVVFGDHTCILKLVDRPFAQGADGIKILKARPKIDGRYLYQFLNYRPVATEEYKRHFSILKDRYVFFPRVERGEQHKIAGCLGSLDELIRAEKQKLDALKAHKKGLMQQLFPDEGETVPRLRFPEFRSAAAWLERTIDDLINSGVIHPPRDGNHGNLHPKSSDYVAKGIPFIMATDLKNGDIDFRGCKFISREQVDTLQKGFAIEGDVLITHKGTIGEVAVVGPIPFPYLMLTPQVTYYRIKDSQRLVGRFLASLFATDAFQDRIGIAAGGGTRDYIGIIEQGKLKMTIPQDVDEQRRIVALLSSLDDLIRAQTRKLSTLSIHKQGLMRQLFPSQLELET